MKLAMTAPEFRAKYIRRTLSHDTIGKAILYEFVYTGLQTEEGSTPNNIKVLYPDLNSLRDKLIETANDVQKFNTYLTLQEWFQQQFLWTVTERNSASGSVSYIEAVISSLIAGEGLEHALDAAGNQSEETREWLAPITAPAYLASDCGPGIDTAKGIIEDGLYFVNAYNTMVEWLASWLTIPEFVIFRVDTVQLVHRITETNRLIKTFLDAVHLYRVPDKMTAEDYNALCAVFAPLPEIVPPVPPENEKLAKAVFDGAFDGTTTIPRLFPAACTNYC